MGDIAIRVVEVLPEPEISVLQREVFADFEHSKVLAQVLASESAVRLRI